MCVTSFNGDSRLPASKIMHAAINIFSPHSSSAIKQIARRKLNFQTDCISLCICEFYFWWRSSMSQSHKVQVIRLYCITSSPLQSPSQTHITSAFSLCDCLCSDRSHSERVYTSGCGSKKKTTTKSTFVALWFYFFFVAGFVLRRHSFAGDSEEKENSPNSSPAARRLMALPGFVSTCDCV